MQLSTTVMAEKRRFKRYSCKEDKNAYVAIRPHFEQIGSLKDICQGGLSFRYLMLNEDKHIGESGKKLKLDLFVSNTGFYLHGLSCRVVYEHPMETTSPRFTETLFRECGLGFCNMSKEDQEQIRLFIKCYTKEGFEF